MGSIYRRGKVWWIKYYRNGKSYRESSQCDRKEVAKRLLRGREGEISEGKVPGICFDRVRFEELAQDYLTDYRINTGRQSQRPRDVSGICKRYSKE